MKYLGWILMVVGGVMMIFSGVRAHDRELVGLHQTDAIIAAIQPWFWMFVSGQVLRLLKFETILSSPQTVQRTDWFAVRHLVLSWLIKMTGVVIILIMGLGNVVKSSPDGSSVDFMFSEVRTIPILLGGLLVLGGELYFRRGKRND